MDTIKSQMQIDDKIIYPETAADCVKYNDTDAKTFMDGVLSSANLSQPVQQILQATDRDSIARILKTSPEKYFDECFNSWNNTGAPAVQDGSLICTATQNIYSVNSFALNNDFSAQIDFSTDNISAEAFLFNCHVSSAIFFAAKVNANATFVTMSRIASNNTKTSASTTLSANSRYKLEVNYSADDSTFRFFLDGSLIDSFTHKYPGGNHIITVAGNYNNSTGLVGKIHEFRLSDCVRHYNPFTPSDNDFILDDHTLSLLHFD